MAWHPHSATELTPVHFQDSQPHSWNTCAVWMEQDWTTSCLSRHTAGERETLHHTSARLLCGACFHEFSVTFSDWEMSCVSSERFRSRQFSTGAAPVSFVFCARSRDSKAPLSTQIYKLLLMNIWWKNSQLDWTLVMSESDKTFSFMDGAIFDFTLVTVAMFTGKKYGLDSRCTFIQTVYLGCQIGWKTKFDFFFTKILSKFELYSNIKVINSVRKKAFGFSPEATRERIKQNITKCTFLQNRAGQYEQKLNIHKFDMALVSLVWDASATMIDVQVNIFI